MKQAKHSERKSFEKWGLPSPRLEPKHVKGKTHNPPPTYPATNHTRQIAWGMKSSISARRFSRPDKLREGGKLTVRGLNPKRYARLENGQIVRRRQN